MFILHLHMRMPDSHSTLCFAAWCNAMHQLQLFGLESCTSVKFRQTDRGALQANLGVIERFGKFDRIAQPGEHSQPHASLLSPFSS